ncbi:hypothetical protein M9H77_16826 [Catharanthus roseus]|uniref:Uncharacterized protein n=1 Tax=Catharanthus roseus TaxID=4058 RepID=A0ACC0B2W5_CATRO|nr:hypothetical protein M9H77_16826 [Catharanthus roseus]
MKKKFNHVYGSSIPTHYNEGTNGGSHSNLDPMKVIMQDLQVMRKDMKERRGNIANLSMEHRDKSNIRGHVTSDTQWGYGNLSLHARTFEHNSCDCYEDNRLGVRNGYNNTSCKTVPRNEVRKGGNYVKMDERFHKRRGDVDKYHDSYDHYEHSNYSKNMYNEHNDNYSYRGV